MDKVQKAEWDEIKRLTKDTNIILTKLKIKLVGDDDVHIGGMSRDVSDLKINFDDHEKSDELRFVKLETHNKVTRAWIGGAVFVIGCLWAVTQFVLR